VEFVHGFPATSGVGFHEQRKTAEVFNDFFPIQRVLHVAEAEGAGIRRHLFGRQQDGFGNRQADFGRQAVVEEFFVCAPPEGIVHDCGAVDGGIFKVGAVKGHVLADAVEQHRIGGRIALGDFFHKGAFGIHAFHIFGVDALYKCLRERAFFAVQNSDFFHSGMLN